jgi:hypothetical protein
MKFAVAFPTAVHAVLLVHETPLRTLAAVLLALGLDWISQLRPFQRSTSVRTRPAAVWNEPTAVQPAAEEQDTPLRKLSVAPPGLGVD